MLFAALAMGFFLAGRAPAFAYELRGYVKDYPSYYDMKPTLLTGGSAENQWLNTTRGRLKFRWFPTYSITFAADYDVSASVGSMVDEDYFQLMTAPPAHDAELLDLSWKLADGNDCYVTHTIDRLYLEYFGSSFTATLGRQRVAWGVVSFFTPLDKFAPIAPAEIDKEEKAGIDAVRVSVPFGALSNIEAIWAPTRDFDDHRVGARVRTNVGEWDLSALGGYFAGDCSAGGSVAVPVADALVKSELLFERGLQEEWEYVGDPLGTGFREPVERHRNYLKGTLAAEYGFEWRNLTLSGEFYYDGSGFTDKQSYNSRPESELSSRLTLARYYTAGTASVLVTPLLTASATSIVNLVDYGYMVSPALEYSAAENLTLRAGAQFYRGDRMRMDEQTVWPDEYAHYPDRYYAIIAWYF